MSAMRTILAVVFISRVAAQMDGLDPAALVAGDECSGDDGTCALNALQLRATSNLSSSSSCQQDTFGSCTVKSCHSSRGPAECWKTKGFKCLCPDGWCAHNGACFPSHGQCATDTGGTCSLLGCKSKRGPTKCVNGKCVCEEGHCAHKGTCYPVSATGGSCQILSCDSSRGPTKCVNGKCFCRDGYVAVQGKCQRNGH
mmetsp:Transcript_58352/g.170609  ORF Transcript_58352/g.170609 Transcript_58352/m.170609 type:complete len:198 (+) Transcript_58352:80-673(+)